MSDLITQIVSGAVTAAIGFFAAYALAQGQRRWDAEDAAAAARAALIQSARIPLEIIRDEIRMNHALYDTSAVEDRISRDLREAVYGLRDEPLIREFERAILPLRNLAHSGGERASYAEKCLPHIEAMLARLSALEARGPTQLRHRAENVP